MNRLLLLVIFVVAPAMSQDLEHFQLERVIQLSDDVLIGTIMSLDIGENGDILLVDKESMTVQLFNKEGNHLTELDASACHPGFNKRPIVAVFAEDSFIFVVNSGPWGYRFEIDGSCLGAVDDAYRVGFHTSYSSDGFIWGFYWRNGGSIAKMDTTGKELNRFNVEETNFPNIVNRWQGGGLVALDGYIYYAGVTSQRIFKYYPDGTLDQIFDNPPDGYRAPSKDFPDNLSPTFFKKAGEIMFSSTMTNDLFALDENKVMIQFWNRDRGLGYQIFDADGALLIEESGLDEGFRDAGRGFAYRVVYPTMDENGEDPNPSIEVYRYVGPGSGGE